MPLTLPPQLPHGEIVEVLDDLFFVTGQTRPVFGGHAMQFSRSMTIVRDGEDLTLINTMRLDTAGLAALTALGQVRNIVKLGSFHGRDDAFYVEEYGATVWSFPGMPHERGVSTDAELRAGHPGPFADADVFVYETSNLPEGHLLLRRHGGVLFACDSLQNMTAPDEFFDDATARVMETQGFFAPANIGPGWRNGSKVQASDFERLLTLPFAHLLSAHGAPLLHDAKAAVAASVERTFGG
jgi:hypothetical protein